MCFHQSTLYVSVVTNAVSWTRRRLLRPTTNWQSHTVKRRIVCFAPCTDEILDPNDGASEAGFITCKRWRVVLPNDGWAPQAASFPPQNKNTQDAAELRYENTMSLSGFRPVLSSSNASIWDETGKDQWKTKWVRFSSFLSLLTVFDRTEPGITVTSLHVGHPVCCGSKCTECFARPTFITGRDSRPLTKMGWNVSLS